MYTCGDSGYNCKSSKECLKCINGLCKDMNECYKKKSLIKFKKKKIDSCKYNPLSMGDLRTIDSYCGKDSNRTIVHFTTDPVKEYLNVRVFIF